MDPVHGSNAKGRKLEHVMDPVHGSNAKGRKTMGMYCLHVDALFITGTLEVLVRANFKIGHEDVNDLMFTTCEVAIR